MAYKLFEIINVTYFLALTYIIVFNGLLMKTLRWQQGDGRVSRLIMQDERVIMLIYS